MASLQAKREVISTQMVEPIELKYVNQGAIGGANWVLPTKEHPTAYLKDAFTIDVTGDVDRKVDAIVRLTVSFELSLSPTSFGFKAADVQFGVKFTEDGKYQYESVQTQIAEMKRDGEKTWVTATFRPLVGHLGPLGGKIDFQLKDMTAMVVKGGLTLYQAKVEQVGFIN